ncbi:MAG: hypothetical protein MUD01_10520 [Chloroflexaceae bacterium]|jgi:hypothetical protein|nr:hypothetical protein [Chloroflexaceae bacterium]
MTKQTQFPISRLLSLGCLVFLLLGGIAWWAVQPRSNSAIRMVANGPNGFGVTFVWRELDPSLRAVQVQRLRLNPFGPAAPQRLRRATTNTLPPITLRDADARPGDCFLAYEHYLRFSSGQPEELAVRLKFLGCVWR